ncbi:MAG TPA: serine hydrolase [Gemmatimonadaceae bacterium]|jgi:CubicO group peptidase (beta-lactamase class C family)
MLPAPLVSLAFALLGGCPANPHCVLRNVPPDSVGMSAERLASIDHVAARGLAADGYPGLAVVIGRHGGLVWERGYGSLDWSQSTPAVDPTQTMFDLASLTKVIATTSAVMVLYDEHRIRLDDPVSKYLRAYRHGAKRQVTIRMLLEHRAGLPPGRNVYRRGRSSAVARQLILATPLEYRPDEREVYSDVGADVLGFVVEAVSGERLDTFVQEHVFRPLGMRSTMFRPPRALRGRIAPTEIASSRGHALRGEVHDETADALGGVAGNAGLFSTAADLAVFAQMMLDGGTYRGVRIVHDSTVALFSRRAMGWRALGWETCSGGASCGRYMSDLAYGHTGFTGTSIWIDPENDLFVIVLANRMHELPSGLAPETAVLADVRADIADLAELSVADDSVRRDMPDALRADLAIGWIR